MRSVVACVFSMKKYELNDVPCTSQVPNIHTWYGVHVGKHDLDDAIDQDGSSAHNSVLDVVVSERLSQLNEMISDLMFGKVQRVNSHTKF